MRFLVSEDRLNCVMGQSVLLPLSVWYFRIGASVRLVSALILGEREERGEIKDIFFGEDFSLYIYII